MIVLLVLQLQVWIRPAKASGTIYIRSDGSIFPSSAPVSTIDNVTYRLTGDVNDEVVVQRSNIVLNGSNHSVLGTGGGYGFTLSSVNGVEITDTNIKGFADGIWLSSSFNTTIIDNYIVGNKFTAISLYSSSNNKIAGNSIADSTYGLYLVSSSENGIQQNNLTETEISGISLESYSNNNNVTENLFSHSGLAVSSSFGNILRENLVNNKPLVFLESTSNSTVTDAGQVVLISCSNIHVKNLELTYTAVGLELWGTTNTEILNSSIENSYYGIWLHSSSNITIIGNNIQNNRYGVELTTSSQNIFIHNNLVNNTHQVHDDAWNDPEIPPSTNAWDPGYSARASGGNYWSDYTGKDEYRNSGQYDAGSDGIGDTPYVMPGGDEDNYPLMGAFHEFDASSGLLVQTVSNFSISDLQFNNSAIFFKVTGEDDVIGFCRMGFPTTFLNGPYNVFVNETECPYYELSSYDSTQKYLYFTFNGPKEMITIIPEFTISMLITLAMIVTTILHTAHFRRKCRKTCRTRGL